MHKIITRKNSSLKGSSLYFHNLRIASLDSGVLRLEVPDDRVAQCRINQFLKAHDLPVVLKTQGEGVVLESRESKRDIVRGNFPRWNEPGACVVINRSVSSLQTQEKKAA